MAIRIGIALAFFAAATFGADLPRAQAAAAPVPAQIAAAKRVFISNTGQDNFDDGPVVIFSGSSDRVYNQFYAAMKQWGRYEVVSTPAEADLVLEIGLTLTDNGLRVPELGRLHVTIRDPKTNVALWAVIRHVRFAARKGNRDKNLDLAIGYLMDGLKGLAPPASAVATQ